MNIMVDGRVLDQTNVGIAIYLRELLPYFKPYFQRIGVLHKNKRVRDFYQEYNYEWIECKFSLTDSHVKSIYETQNMLQKGEWDIFYSPTWFPRIVKKIKKTKIVITMHDLIYLQESASLFRYLNGYLSTLVGGLIADKIITVSAYSQKQIVKYYPFFEQKIKKHSTPFPSKKMEKYDDSILNKINIKPKKFFLFVSAMRDYKGFNQTVEAFKILQNSIFKLVLVGKPDIGQIETKQMSSDNIIFTGYISDEELNALYHHAFALVFPSKIEGFGLPILEAQYHGCPVITTTCPAIVETAGNGALFLRTQSPAEISLAMQSLINSPDLREMLIKKGLINYKRFIPEKVCVNLIREIASIL